MIVWLASYPRSGNTLVRLILKSVFNCSTYSKHDDASDIGANPRVSEQVGHRFLPQPWFEAYPLMRDSTELHLVKTHDPPEDAGKTIYIVRDGRAACQSFHHYLCDFQHVDANYAVGDVIAGFTPAGSWSEHLDAWEPLTRPGTLLLRYEDLVADPSTAIQQIAEHLRLSAIHPWQNHFEQLHELNPYFFRAGVENDPRNALHGKDSDIFFVAHNNWMRQLHYDLLPPRDIEKAKRHYHHLRNAKINEHLSLRKRLNCAEGQLTAQQSQLQAGLLEADQLRASREQMDLNARHLQARADQLSTELEQGKSSNQKLTHSLQENALQIQLLKNENESERRIAGQLRSALGTVQESLTTNQRALEIRVQETESLIVRLQNQSTQNAASQQDLQAQRAIAGRLVSRLERADRRLSHLRATGHQHQLELNSRIQAVREQLAAEAARLAGLKIRLIEAQEHAQISQQQSDSALAAKDEAIKALAAATREMDTRLRMLLTSRFMRLGWKFGFGSVPYWDDPTKDELTGLVDAVLIKAGSSMPGVSAQPCEMERALDHLAAKGFRPTVALDIGAAKGCWTRTAANRWASTRFFMIDPLRESEPALRAICNDNRFAYLLTAVGSQSGEQLMNLTPDFDGSSLLEFPKPDPSRQRMVPVTTIDELLKSGRILPPDLVKIDVQGFELEVMTGASELFNTTEVFILEVNLFRFSIGCSRVDEVVKYMADRQYFLFDLAGLLRRPFENDLGQMDLVFVRADSPLIGSTRWS